MDRMNGLIGILKGWAKRPMIAFPAVSLFLGVFVFTIAFARSPKFPDDLPSAQTLDIRTENIQAQKTFSERFSRLMRRSHGNLLLVKQTDRVAMVSGNIGHGYVKYLHQYNQIRETRFLSLAQEFAAQEGLGFKVRKTSEPKASPTYELSFLKAGDLWVQVNAKINGLAVKAPVVKKPEPIEPAELAVAATEPVSGPKLVIVIDNLGQNIDHFNQFADLSGDLTFSILPERHHSERTAREAHARGMEVLLQMPMEPVSYPLNDPGKGALLNSDEPAVLSAKLKDALDSVPYAKGVNNHMGSAFTANEDGMALVMKALGEQGLFYLNNRTSATEVPADQAVQFAVPFFNRNLFIDETPGLESAREALQQAVQMAKDQGFAVAIGRPKAATLEALKELLPELEQQGVTLIRASGLKG